MVNKLLNVYLKREKLDDRDSYINKRIDLPGVLLGQLFKQYYKKMINDIRRFFKKKNHDDSNPINVINQIKPNTIEQGIKTGLSQVLQRYTYLQTISYLRRIMSPSVDNSTTKVTSIRHVHNIQYGYVCPVETPEGHKIGLIKNLAITATVTHNMDDQILVLKKLSEEYVTDISNIPTHLYNKFFKVFINGEWIGFVKKEYEYYQMLKEKRLLGDINKLVSIVFDIQKKEILIYCDQG